jgi:16S rRNA (cytosine1402-N4)-methyltransferase
MDVDSAELERTRLRLAQEKTFVSFHHSNYAGIAKVLQKENLTACDIIFADLGVSSMQIDNPDRGLSYKHEGPLDMRMDDRLKQTAADLLNKLTQEKLSDAFWELADEEDHLNIAQEIVARRQERPFAATDELVDVIFEAKGINKRNWQKANRASKTGILHPAAKVFQALRILVNDEIGCLKELLRIAPYCLKPGGRIGIISFHSGEDRLVKHSFRDNLRDGIYQTIVKDPITPQAKEIFENPRSASAKFRWAVMTQPSD